VRGEERPGKSEEPEALQRDESSRQVGGESSQRELRREREEHETETVRWSNLCVGSCRDLRKIPHWPQGTSSDRTTPSARRRSQREVSAI
jgi:hypothetical protein